MTTTTIAKLCDVMQRIAPVELAESWDNVGLLLGDPSAKLTGPVLVTIDLTESVMDEALKMNAGAIVAYHPPIFSPIKRLTAGTSLSRSLLRAANASMAIYCPHTALDSARDGLSDWLAGTVMDPGAPKGADRRALLPRAERRDDEQLKIVTFVPPNEVDRVREALASCGAGMIGLYRACAFASPGTGTFLAERGASPAVGKTGELERVSELRLEMVCSRRSLALALATLREFHPYEEPAVDVYALEPRPVRTLGVGRRVLLDHPVPIETLAQRVKKALGVSHVMVARASDKPVTCVGVCPGSGNELMDAAMSEGCDVYLTGEMKHHDVLAALSRGLSLILAGHTATERGFMPELAQRISAGLPGVRCVVAASDRDPLTAL